MQKLKYQLAKTLGAVNFGANPGVTEVAQEVKLEKHSTNGLTRNFLLTVASRCIGFMKLYQFYDTITPVETILERVGPEQFMLAYGVPQFNSTAVFLAFIRSSRGKINVGGGLDMN